MNATRRCLDDLNLRYQHAISDRRKATNENDVIRLHLVLQKITGHFHEAIIRLLKSTVDNLHSSRKIIKNGIIYEDSLVKIQFIADYQNGTSKNTLFIAC